MSFESTITEADFKRPLLEPAEERIARELRPDPDLAVDGFSRSLVAWIMNWIGRR